MVVAAAIAWCAASGLGPAGPARAAAQPSLQLLLVGNSFVRGIKRPLRELFRSSGSRVRVKTRAPSGGTLARHASARATRRAIASRTWSYVFLQEQSDGIDGERYDDARVLDQQVAAAGARTVFFMTWRDRGVPIAEYDALRGTVGGSEGYVPIAFELGAAIAPVGWAVRGALLDGPPFDLWRDGHHLSPRGKYLAACVCFATITQIDPVGLAAPRRLSPADAAYLQELARRTVLGEADAWNLPEIPPP